VRLRIWDFILVPVGAFLITVLLLFSSCAPDPVVQRQREGESIEAKIKWHQGQIDSLKRVNKSIWDM
jgi:hypothetical protein